MMSRAAIQHTSSQIGSGVTGTATAAGGMWTWLDVNAGAIGVCMTAASLLAFLLFQGLSYCLRKKEVALMERAADERDAREGFVYSASDGPED